MAKERISTSMSLAKMLYVMSDGNPGALTCMAEMIKHNPQALSDILYFDSMEIYGAKIYMLWNDCCGRDIVKLSETIQHLRSNNISKEVIHENLNRVRALPFI